MDGEISVVSRQFPSAVFLLLEGHLVRKESFRNLIFRLPGRRVVRSTDNDYAIIPSRLLAGVQAGRPNRILLHIAQLLLAFEHCQLVLLEDAEPLVLVSILNSVHSLLSEL